MQHGQSGTKLYQVWNAMKGRCLNPNDKHFASYGGRGVSVCNAWRQAFVVFHAWSISSGYRDGLEIDRIDVNGSYEPCNCRWVTRKQQAANTRKRRDAMASKYKGVTRPGTSKKWQAAITSDGIFHYLGVYESQLQAALAYDDAAFSARGEYAFLNFPERKRACSTS